MSRTTRSLSHAVVSAVAERESISVADVEPPLYHVLDAEALDALFARPTDDRRGTTGRVVFDYLGYEVTVHSDGRVDLRSTDGTE